MALSAAVALGALPTSGSQDFEVSGFGAPSAAIILANRGGLSSAGDQFGGTAFFSVGFWDGTDARAVAIRSVDNISPSTSLRANREQNDGYGAIYYQSTSAYWTVSAAPGGNGIRLTLASGTISAGITATVILLRGTTNASAGVRNLGTATGNQAINLGWRANCVLVASVALGGGDAWSTHAILSFGVATIADDDTVVQRMVGIFDENLADPTNAGSVARNDAVGGQYYQDTQAWSVEIEPDNSGFIFDTDVNSNSDYVYYLALQLPNAEDCKLSGVSTPTTGTVPFTEQITSVGFQPQALLAYGARVDGFVAGDPDAGLFFGATDGTSTRALGLFSDDGAAPTDTFSYKTDDLIAITNASGSGMLASAALDTFDSDGYTLEWDQIDTTDWRLNILAFGDSSSAALPTLSNPTLVSAGGNNYYPRVTATY